MSQTISAGMSGPLKNAVLIAGPTASGKSRLAMDMAERMGGVIVNADSMQVYRQLHALTARPSRQETDRVPHFLYGHVDASQSYSTGRWLADVEAFLSSGAAGAKPVIFVGGTGLYFTALTQGLSQMPAVSASVRQHWRQRLAEAGAPQMHAELARRDPAAAGLLSPADGQRIVRALEVFDGSGKSIGEWQRERGSALVDAQSAHKIIIDPARDQLHLDIDRRFDAMLENGALDEVRSLLEADLDASLPVMKAIGVPQLAAYLHGTLPFAEAVDRAKIATRQYAKRQRTWFRNQMGEEWLRRSMP